MSKIEDIQRVSLQRGIIFPTAEIYSTISGFYEYGPIGFLLKKKLIDHWRDFFVNSDDNIFEIEGCTIVPEKVFVASGHLKSFVDPITQCKKCKSLYKADDFIREKAKVIVEGKTPNEMSDVIKKKKIKCSRCGGELSEVRLFNLMLKTEISPTGGQVGYLRPETAQNIFTSFQRVFRSTRSKLPMGIAQVGRSFRNEISPRHFIIRVREFNQNEIELFFDSNNAECPRFKDVKDKKIIIFTREAQKKGKKPVKMTAEKALKKIVKNEWLVYFMAKEFEFYKSIGIPEKNLRFRHMLPEETPHYSGGNFDLEIEFDFGWKETVGNAYRTDYDLKKHMELSGKDMTVLTEDNRKIIPHVVEPSFGIERTIYGILLHNFVEDKKRGWNWFKFPVIIAPYTAAIFPLVKKDKIPKKAKQIFDSLKKDFDIFYDERGSIGKRYARSDEIGTPFAITIDFQTLEDNTVTIRNRDSTKQIRVDADHINIFLEKAMKSLK